jgi:xylulokinase
MSWDDFSQALRSVKPGNAGGIILPWFDAEITPTVLQPTVLRYGLDPKDGPANVRAVVEAQMMSMSIHSQWMGVHIDTVHATGGAAKNRDILKVMADVLGADVYQFETTDSACLGAALRAYHGDEIAEGRRISWEEVTAGFTEPVASSRIQPDPAAVALYAEFRKVYAACEAHALRGGDDPVPLIEAFRKAYP